MHDKTHSDFTETQLTTRLVYDGRLLKVHEDSVRLPDGKTARREYVQHPGAAIIIPMLDDETVLLERQYRYALKRHFYEFPAGKIDAGEDPLVLVEGQLLATRTAGTGHVERLRVSSRKSQLAVSLDGEVVSAASPLDYRIRKRALRVIAP